MKGKRSTAGIAIITAISFMVVTLAFISTAFIVSISNTRLSGDQVFTTKAQFAAQAGIDEAILRLWHGATQDMLDTNDIRGLRRDIPDYRDRWQTITQWSPYTWDANNQLLPAQDTDGNDIAGEFGDPISFSGQVDDGTGNLASYEVIIERRDDSPDSSTLRITSTGTLPNGSQRRLQQELAVAFPPFELDFALLTDFVNCTFCHSAFTSIEMGYDRDVGMRDQEFLVDLTNENAREQAAAGEARIRVAGLRNLFINTGWAHINTLVAGTIYSRGPQNIMYDGGPRGGRQGRRGNVWGPIYQGNSPIISDADWEEFRLDGAPNSDDKLLSCTPNANDFNAGCEQAFARFYENYPIEIDSDNDGRPDTPSPIDGVVPEVLQFPSPIQDLNGDRRIDNDEWAAVMRDKELGDLDGAAEIWFSPTDADGAPSERDSASAALPFQVYGQDITIPGLIDTDTPTETPTRGIAGNLILIGTDAAPIEISGTVYIDGDLIIQGPIDPGNAGVFMVRGNIYIVGDVIYDCNGPSRGTQCDYTTPASLPRLAFVTGGMMILGSPNQSEGTADFPNAFGRRNGGLPMQGELAAFNAFQFDTYEEVKQSGANTLGEVFVPRYYLYHEGDEIPIRCNFDGERGPDNDNRPGTDECRDFVSRSGGGDRLSARENIPCVPGQIASFPNANQPRCVSGERTTAPVGTPLGPVIAIDQDGSGIFEEDRDIIVRNLSQDPIDDNDLNTHRTNNNNLPNWGSNWGTERGNTVGSIPVEQDGQGFARMVSEIFVEDARGNQILDDDGNPVEPVYMYMSPNNSWLAPAQDLDGNGIDDFEDDSLVESDNMFSRQKAIAAMEVVTGAWVEYGMTNGRNLGQANERPMRIDGLLYTNNAILGYLPRGWRGTPGSGTDGGLILNGSVISWETGLLIYGGGNDRDNDCEHGTNERNMFNTGHWMCIGLRIQYDRRLPSLIDVRTNVPVLARASSRWVEIND
jgi:hypothetical protein